MKKVMTVVFISCLALAVTSCQTYSYRATSGNPLEGLDLLKAGETMRSSSCDPNIETGNGDARPIAPGKTLTIADLEGPGRHQSYLEYCGRKRSCLFPVAGGAHVLGWRRKPVCGSALR